MLVGTARSKAHSTCGESLNRYTSSVCLSILVTRCTLVGRLRRPSALARFVLVVVVVVLVVHNLLSLARVPFLGSAGRVRPEAER